ncbi:MAG: CvpA family protein [Alphaproteobacteria bacterium]|nr:CvpA family protein [Alphaproteobacteria bacterium]
MQDFPINPADVTVAVLVILSGIFAMARGFVREVLSLASWVGAALVTLWGFGHARPYVHGFIANSLLADIVTGAALFIISLIVFSMIGGGIASLVRGTGLNALDRSLGFVFGLVRGILLVAVMWLGVVWAIPAGDQPIWLREARTRPLVEHLAEYLRGFAPPELRGRVQTVGGRVQPVVTGVQQYEAILKAPLTPQAKPATADTETGYKADERHSLDGLIQRAQPPQAPPPEAGR